MKTGKSLQQLAIELDRQAKAKKDYLADTRRLSMTPAGDLVMKNGSDHIMPCTKNFHAQVASKLNIPKAYYDRMRIDQPALLADNVNTWFHSEPAKRMVRTLDGQARALLSDRYRPLDHFDLAQAVLPVLTELGAEIHSAEVTESKFYLKAVIPGMTEIIAPEGMDESQIKFDGSQASKHIFVDEVSPGIVISNSETGEGGLNVWPGIHTRRCTNLASFRGDGFNKTHIGGALSKLLAEGTHLAQYIQDDTRKTSDELIWKQVRDFCHASCSGDVFQALVTRLRESRGQKITGDIPEVIKVAGEKFGLTQGEQSGILFHLIEGGELSKYGLSNAVTQFSQRNEVGYDRASDLENIGADIIEMPQHDWELVAS